MNSQVGLLGGSLIGKSDGPLRRIEPCPFAPIVQREYLSACGNSVAVWR